MASAIFPWPSRAERHARVAEARRAAERAQREAAKARPLKEELRQLREKNHVKEALDVLIQRRAEGRQ